MLGLTDSQMDAFMRAAQALDPDLRVPFLKAVASALRDQPIGDGSCIAPARRCSASSGTRLISAAPPARASTAERESPHDSNCKLQDQN